MTTFMTIIIDFEVNAFRIILPLDIRPKKYESIGCVASKAYVASRKTIIYTMSTILKSLIFNKKNCV